MSDIHNIATRFASRDGGLSSWRREKSIAVFKTACAASKIASESSKINAALELKAELDFEAKLAELEAKDAAVKLIVEQLRGQLEATFATMLDAKHIATRSWNHESFMVYWLNSVE